VTDTVIDITYQIYTGDVVPDVYSDLSVLQHQWQQQQLVGPTAGETVLSSSSFITVSLHTSSCGTCMYQRKCTFQSTQQQQQLRAA
jgi:hypothetical protein